MPPSSAGTTADSDDSARFGMAHSLFHQLIIVSPCSVLWRAPATSRGGSYLPIATPKSSGVATTIRRQAVTMAHFTTVTGRAPGNSAWTAPQGWTCGCRDHAALDVWLPEPSPLRGAGKAPAALGAVAGTGFAAERRRRIGLCGGFYAVDVYLFPTVEGSPASPRLGEDPDHSGVIGEDVNRCFV
jgi:hypothetical protein